MITEVAFWHDEPTPAMVLNVYWPVPTVFWSLQSDAARFILAHSDDSPELVRRHFLFRIELVLN